MNVRQIAMIQQPRSRVWPLLRDTLAELAAGLEDIESVAIESRATHDPGVLTVVTLWRARSALPALLSPGAAGIAWTDHSTWRDDRFETCFEVTPHVLGGRLRCAGVTQYVDAMGGRGTRVILDVGARLVPDALAGKEAEGDSAILETVQTIAATLVCKNFRRLLELADQRLRQCDAAPAGDRAESTLQ